MRIAVTTSVGQVGNVSFPAAEATLASCVTSSSVGRGLARAQEPEHVTRGRRVEIAGGLVGENYRGLVRERAGERDPLLLPAGELRWRCVVLVRNPKVAHQLGRGRPRLPAWPADAVPGPVSSAGPRRLASPSG